MKDEELDNLLSHGDAGISRPVLHGDVAERVMRRARRRRVVRRVVVAGVLLLAVSPVLWRSRRPSISQRVTVATPIPDTSRFDAIIAQKTAEAILRHRREEAEIARIPPDPRQTIHIELEATAGFLIAAGDEMARDPGGVTLAADDYRRVESCFPGTTWAATASERLHGLHL